MRILFIIFFAMFFMFISCSGGGSNTNDDPDESIQTDKDEPVDEIEDETVDEVSDSVESEPDEDLVIDEVPDVVQDKDVVQDVDETPDLDVEPEPLPEVIVDKLSIETSEDGTSDIFSVKLNTKPANPVTVTIEGLDETEGKISLVSLMFNEYNWSGIQKVNVTGLDDADADGDVTYSLTFSVASDDLDYNEIVVDSVEITMSGVITMQMVISDKHAIRNR